MTFKEIALSRITPKFRNSPNFKAVLSFMVGFFDERSADIDIIGLMRDMESDSSIVLNELGKILGVYPRPRFATSITGNPTIFTFDLTPLDTVPLATLDDYGVRELSNEEYTRVLKSTSRFTSFKGTLEDWEDVIADAANADVYLTNKRSSFDIIVLKDLSVLDKALVEFILNRNNLTVSKGFLGTTTGAVPFAFDVTPLDVGAFINPW